MFIKDSKLARRLLAGAAAVAVASAVTAKNWEDWGAPASIESLPGSSTALNTPAIDGCASTSADGLTLAFNSDRGGNHDIYLATRASKSQGFGNPVRLPAPINTDSVDACPTMGPGNRLYFTSFRHDPAGDLYVSKRGPDGWGAATRLGPNINTPGLMEETADFYEDEDGREVMVFTRRQVSGAGGKIYESVEGGPADLIAGGPHSSASDNRGSVTRDGLTIFWDSTRTGTLGGPDLWYATRSSTSQPFGAAVHLVELSSPAFDARPFISKDGTLLTFASGRTGSESPAPDMWFVTRSKATGN